MAEITAAAVKELRDRSGAGMMDCKKALSEANGDMEAAVDWLRRRNPAAPPLKVWTAWPSPAPRASRSK